MVFGLGPRSGGGYPRARSRSLGHRARKDLGAQRSESMPLTRHRFQHRTRHQTASRLRKSAAKIRSAPAHRRFILHGPRQIPARSRLQACAPGSNRNRAEFAGALRRDTVVPGSDSWRGTAVHAQAYRNRQATAALGLSDKKVWEQGPRLDRADRGKDDRIRPHGDQPSPRPYRSAGPGNRALVVAERMGFEPMIRL